MPNHDSESPRSQAPSSPQAVQALRDIDFIKQLIERNRRKLPNAAPYLLIWGAYLVVGFIGMQIDETQWPMWFWSFGTLVCGALSAWVGIRQSRGFRKNASEPAGSAGWTFGLPFLMLMLSGGFMMATDIVNMTYAALFWFMLIGVAYVFLGALVGQGAMLLGIWFIVLAILTRLFWMDYQYLVLGLLGGGSIVVTGWMLQRRRRRHG
ncbi:hypothetical protein [Cohnella nanjingensis]|uniref:DUF2157 domain-containing protein n=1 Tax=Cohnella nanjingensis TaxID=1387779 RepID=A0A7X0VGC9_9BACL|nr:hypothetical protein [Cohnella nanjingensis]MBB6672731.1 hypothetical protein [Cohnella nanjingensis]